ncbi:MAG: beta-propeller fold lactonase family protein, partial [Gallionella sp.]
PSGKFVYVVNKLSNSISAYSVDTSTGALASIDADGSTTAYDASIATKSTPISIAIDHSGSHAYVANAGISASTSNVSVYSIDSLTGALTAIPATGVPGTSTFISTGGTTPNSVEVSPDDKLLYVTNRGSNNITSFIIGSAGELTYSSMSTAHVTNDNPVSIAIDSTGINIYVVNTGNNTVSLYHANTAGVLAYQSSLATGTTPISITIDSTGQYVYVANYGSNDISVYSVAGGTLALVNCGGGTSCNGSYFKAGTTPNAITTSP